MGNILDYMSPWMLLAYIVIGLLEAVLIIWLVWGLFLKPLGHLITECFHSIVKKVHTYLFNKVYLYEYQSRETIAARKLAVGYFRDNLDYPCPFHLIRGVTAAVNKGLLIITIIADEPKIFAGNNYFWVDRFQDYVIASSYFSYKKYEGLHVQLKESKYWPTSYELDEKAFYSGYENLWQESGDNVTFE